MEEGERERRREREAENCTHDSKQNIYSYIFPEEIVLLDCFCVVFYVIVIRFKFMTANAF